MSRKTHFQILIVNKRTPELVVSNSAGTISILSGPSLETTEEWEAHTFEPWIAAWDAWSSNTIYTGHFPSKLVGCLCRCLQHG